jgi:hypothetical protein
MAGAMTRSDVILAVHHVLSGNDSVETKKTVQSMHRKLEGAYQFLFEMEEAAQKNAGSIVGDAVGDMAKILRDKLEG